MEYVYIILKGDNSPESRQQSVPPNCNCLYFVSQELLVHAPYGYPFVKCIYNYG